MSEVFLLRLCDFICLTDTFFSFWFCVKVFVVYTEHCEDCEPVRNQVKYCVDEIGQQVTVHCEARFPEVNKQGVSDYADCVAHCEDYKCAPYLPNLVLEGMIFNAKHFFDCVE